MENNLSLDDHIAGHEKMIKDIKSREFTVHGEDNSWVVKHGKYVFLRTYCQELANDSADWLKATVDNIVADLQKSLDYAKEQCAQTSLKLFEKH